MKALRVASNYNIHSDRHVTGLPRIVAPFAVYQTEQEGEALEISEKTVLVDSFAALSLLATPLLARSGTIEMSRAVLLETTETGLMMHRRLGIALGTMGEDAAVARLSSKLVSRKTCISKSNGEYEDNGEYSVAASTHSWCNA